MNYKVGTRGSQLALVQTQFVVDKLKNANPNDTFEIKIFKTTGDKNLTTGIDNLGGRGVFVDTIEQALLNDEIQFAVHSMKDMPENPLDGLAFAKAWEREDARDVLVLRDAKSLNDLPYGATIATCSKRRDYQLKMIRPDIKTTLIRGNIDTRLKKLADGYSNGVKIDGIIIAAAGLKRLGRESEITQYFTVDQIIPSPAQGTLAIELRENNAELLKKLNALSNENNDIITNIERGFLRAVGANCHEPVGAYASIENGKLCLRAIYGNDNGTKLAKTKIIADKENIVQLAVADIMGQLNG